MWLPLSYNPRLLSSRHPARRVKSKQSKSNRMCERIATNFCNVSYDILTICISIADVTTDIIVAIDFYNNGRMTFFWISLTILILAQCAYAMAFGIEYLTI